MSIEQLYTLYLQSTGVTTDSRQIPEGSIFFALKGETFNGNAFAAEALHKGASYAVIDEPVPGSETNHRFILVNNVLTTLQNLALHHRQQFTFPVLAITGSNGKTTTKELVAAVLQQQFKTAYTKGNLNNHIGIPLTLLSINKNETQFAVIEMGANHQGEIASYCRYVQPDYGLITNVGLAHIEGFGGFEGVVKGKTELYRHLVNGQGKIFVSADNDILNEQWKNAGFPPERVVTYGTAPNAYCSGHISGSGGFLQVSTCGVTIHTNLVGQYNFENVMSAVCIGRYLGISPQKIKQAIENYVPSNNRSQKITAGTNTIILDAYNANPSSMSEAIKNFAAMQGGFSQRLLILGEMMELGPYSRAEHEKIAAQAAATGAQQVYVGEGFAFMQQQPGVTWLPDVQAAARWWQNHPLQNALVLIKGSRKNRLELVIQ